MFLTYQYRLLPTRKQHRALESILESQRQLYNAALQERIDAYRKCGIRITYIDQTRGLSEWRRTDTDATVLPVTIQRATLKRLDNAYADFFRRVKKKKEPGFPRFRGIGWFRSFGCREFGLRVGVCLRNGRIRFKGMPGGLRAHLHRPLPLNPVIKCATIKRDVLGWSVSLSVEISAPALRAGQRHVGIDLGLTTLAVLSDGNTLPSLKAARLAERRLRTLDRAVSRKRRGSRSHQSAVARRKRGYAKVARQRSDHLHRASALVVHHYDVIAVEALTLQALIRSRLSKQVHDASWGTFISMLKYKAERAGARVIEVNPRGTTQECSRCGKRVPKELGDRIHQCSSCGLSIDRDLNAARNILNRAGVGPGLLNVVGYGKRAGEILSERRAVYAGRGEIHPTLRLY